MLPGLWALVIPVPISVIRLDEGFLPVPRKADNRHWKVIYTEFLS